MVVLLGGAGYYGGGDGGAMRTPTLTWEGDLGRLFVRYGRRI